MAWTRRRLLYTAAASSALGSLGGLGCSSSPPAPAGGDALDVSSIDAAFRALVPEDGDFPGFAAALVRHGEVVWSGGYGLADLATGRARTADDLQNIASVTKTLTATLALQQVERGALDLDADVQESLDFPVRNPRFPDTAISLRQLLTHHSSILDFDAYDESYRCGDQEEPLAVFLERYFTSETVENHFHVWEPGTLDPPEEPRAYSNVAYGLIGHLVERATGLGYEEALRRDVLLPLGMRSSGILLSTIDESRHVVPYSIPGADVSAEFEAETQRLAQDRSGAQQIVPGEPFAHCHYSFGTPPDGLLRTSANELARFVAAWARGGELDGRRILEEETVRAALSDRHHGRALCWSQSQKLPGSPYWLHGGGDPGIATLIAFRERDAAGFVLLCNTGSPQPGFRQLLDPLLEAMNQS